MICDHDRDLSVSGPEHTVGILLDFHDGITQCLRWPGHHECELERGRRVCLGPQSETQTQTKAQEDPVTNTMMIQSVHLQFMFQRYKRVDFMWSMYSGREFA